MKCSISFLLFLAFVLGSTLADHLTVQTTGGYVRGDYGGRTIKNNQIYRWRGIPYAEPPVGNLRFEPPVPKRKWNGILDATQNCQPCLQGSDPVLGSEDCLHIQIYSPQAPSFSRKLPVMVFIHGGAFWFGENFENFGVGSLLDEGVIVVGVHYRLGILGFLSTGDEVVPGNNGIKDQVLALKWIHANIRNFGGDPSRITLFGQSAGAAAISYLLQTPLTRGLFSAAIIQSGSSLNPWAKAQKSIELTREVGVELGIKNKSNKDLIKELRTVSPEKLQEASVKARNWALARLNLRVGLVFVPVIEYDHEGAVITEKTYELLANGSFHHVPIMTGFTSLEMQASQLPTVIRLWLLKYDTDVIRLAPYSLNVNSYTMRKVGLAVRRKYFGLSPVSHSDAKTNRFISDDQFTRGITKAVELYSAKTNVYFYYFTYLGNLTVIKGTNRAGAAHTDDLYYLFDSDTNGSNQDYIVKSRMVRLWTNFAKTFNPTPQHDPLLNNVRWPANRGSGPLKALDIGNDLVVIGSPAADSSKFWDDDIFNKFGKRPYDTY